jgi:hypothetical protein
MARQILHRIAAAETPALSPTVSTCTCPPLEQRQTAPQRRRRLIRTIPRHRTQLTGTDHGRRPRHDQNRRLASTASPTKGSPRQHNHVVQPGLGDGIDRLILGAQNVIGDILMRRALVQGFGKGIVGIHRSRMMPAAR